MNNHHRRHSKLMLIMALACLVPVLLLFTQGNGAKNWPVVLMIGLCALLHLAMGKHGNHDQEHRDLPDTPSPPLVKDDEQSEKAIK